MPRQELGPPYKQKTPVLTYFDNMSASIKEGRLKKEQLQPKNAAQLLLAAIEAKGVTLHPSGIPEYHAFSKRDDEFAMYGNREGIDKFIKALKNQAFVVGGAKFLFLIVGESGTGKSTFAEAIKRIFEEYVRSQEHILTAIEGCPQNEHPFNVISNLDPKQQEALKDAFGISHSNSDLCPHCKKKMDNGEALNVVPFSFSINQGIGISKIDPGLTQRERTDEAQKELERRILMGHRGILEFAELGQHEEKFLRSINDLIRAQIWGNHRLDTVEIGHTTRAEWEKIAKQDQFKGLRERTMPIDLYFNTIRSDEIKIYEQAIRQSGLSSVLAAPQTLETFASIAILTRLERSRKFGNNVSIEDKLEIYDRNNIADISQDAIKELMKEGREDLKEGEKGVSPVFMRELLGEILAQNQTYIHPLKLFAELNRKIKDAPPEKLSIDKNEFTAIVEKARKKYEQDLLQTFIQASSDLVKQPLQAMFNHYCEEAYYLLSEEVRIDKISGDPAKPDEKLLQGIENAFNSSMSYVQRHDLRMKAMHLSSKAKKEKKQLPYTEIPVLKIALQNLLSVESQDFRSILKNLHNLDEKQRDHLGRVKEILQEKYGFHERYLDELIAHVGKSLL